METVKERLDMEEGENMELVHQHLARYEFAKAFVQGKRVLDVACGSGYGTAMLKEGGATYVLGVDSSEDVVRLAKSRYLQDDLVFTPGTAEKLSLYGKFDIIVSFETIEHLVSPEAFLAEVVRVLSPGGCLLISTPVRERGTLHDKPQNPFHVREWSQDEFQGLLDQYFGRVTVYGQYNFKRLFPYSRTLQRVLFRSLLPRHFDAIDGYPVRAAPPSHPGFRFEMAIFMALCGLEK